jgi:glycosyltransferase involved in cell wall biosynthesis
LKVSIITITYNAGQTLESCIRSVAAQYWPDIEYIVVDGGSDDGSVSVISNHEEKNYPVGVGAGQGDLRRHEQRIGNGHG